MPSLVIDEMDLEMCANVQEVLELCIPTVQYMLTQSELEQIKSIIVGDTPEAISNRKTIINDYIYFYLVQSVKACTKYSNINGTDDTFTYVAVNHPAIIELTIIYLRESLTSRSLSDKGNSSIKSISSNGRSVQFMNTSEVGIGGIPQSIQDRLPKPKRVRVW